MLTDEELRAQLVALIDFERDRRSILADKLVAMVRRHEQDAVTEFKLSTGRGYLIEDPAQALPGQPELR